LKDFLDRCELTVSCVIGITTDNAASKYSMSRILLSILETSGIECPALTNHIPLVLATVPVLDPAGFIGLRGNGLTPSKIDDFFSEPSL